MEVLTLCIDPPDPTCPSQSPSIPVEQPDPPIPVYITTAPSQQSRSKTCKTPTKEGRSKVSIRSRFDVEGLMARSESRVRVSDLGGKLNVLMTRD